MGTKYSSVASSGYNASPPADDGSTSESNKVRWSYIKSKLGDPIKTLAEAINSALVTALDHSARSVTSSDTAAASDNERVIEVKSASVQITLSDAATMAAGYMVTVANQSSGSCTVKLATATDTIDMVTNTTNTIQAYETRRYIVNTAANGYITSSNTRVAASDTVAGVVEYAVQSEMEAGSSNTLVVTPGRQHFHPSAVKGWCEAGTVGTVTAAYNVTSVTDEGTGLCQINWTVPASSATSFMPWSDCRSDSSMFATSGNSITNASILRVVVRNDAGTLTDPDQFCGAMLGDI